MCNAWNHPLRCRCGWGGEGHLGGGAFNAGAATLQRPFLILEGSSRARKVGPFDSFIVPNAKCPECKKPVYFYQSEFGGRVFFDDLGPPWPKHPCTDNSRHRTSSSPVDFVT